MHNIMPWVLYWVRFLTQESIPLHLIAASIFHLSSIMRFMKMNSLAYSGLSSAGELFSFLFLPPLNFSLIIPHFNILFHQIFSLAELSFSLSSTFQSPTALAAWLAFHMHFHIGTTFTQRGGKFHQQESSELSKNNKARWNSSLKILFSQGGSIFKFDSINSEGIMERFSI